MSHQEKEKEVSISTYENEVRRDEEEEIGDYAEKEQNGSHENNLTLMGKYNSLLFYVIRLTFGKQLT